MNSVYKIKNWIGDDAASMRIFPATRDGYPVGKTIAIQSRSTEFSYTLHLTSAQAIDLAAALVEFANADEKAV